MIYRIKSSTNAFPYHHKPTNTSSIQLHTSKFNLSSFCANPAMSKINGGVVRKERRRSLSSVSGLLEAPSREEDYSFSSPQFHRSSSLSVHPEENGGSRAQWSLPWRWSRMSKSYNKKTLRAPSRRSMDRDKVDATGIVKGQNGAYSLSTTSSLSLKYQPKSFQEIAGNEVVINAISAAIYRRRAARVYLFYGPSGTGKTSAARVFTASMNCESSLKTKPCWSCQACSRSIYVLELCSGSRLSGFEKAKTLLQNTSFVESIPGFKVFIVEECHVLTMEAWDDLLAMVEDSENRGVIFVLITTNGDLVPAKVLSRCQKYCFSKLRDGEIRNKIEKIVKQEGIVLEEEAMQLIVAKADGSLREAENILDQLTLLGRRITASMAQQIVGSFQLDLPSQYYTIGQFHYCPVKVSLIQHDRLQDLLEAALSGDSVKTVKITTEIMETGVDPQTIMSQLAALIKDNLSNAAANEPSFIKSKAERLCLALKVLVGVERQSKSPIDQSTQVFAALLEIASHSVTCTPSNFTLPKDNIDELSSKSADMKWHRQTERKFSINDILITEDSQRNKMMMNENEENRSFLGKAMEREPIGDIEEIWMNILESIQNKDMKDFLLNQVKLASLTITTANAILHLMFNKPEDKQKAQMSEESLSRALQSSIGLPVTLNMSLQPLGLGMIEQSPDSTFKNQNPECSHSRKQQEAQEILQKMKNNLEYQEMNGPTPGREHIIRIPKPRTKQHRGLSVSSIPQSDASVEPYSQDILFEHTNKDRDSNGRQNSKLQKGSSKAQKDKYPRVDVERKGRNRGNNGNLPWSCKEIFCQDNIK